MLKDSFGIPLLLALVYLETTHGISNLPVVAKCRSKTACLHRLVNHGNECRFRWFRYRKKLSPQNIRKSFAFLGVRESNSSLVTTGGEGRGILIKLLFIFHSDKPSGSRLYRAEFK